MGKCQLYAYDNFAGTVVIMVFEVLGMHDKLNIRERKRLMTYVDL